MKQQPLFFIATQLFVSLIGFGVCHAQQNNARHPAIGTSFDSEELSITLVGRKQNYNWRESNTQDRDILSPKSVNIHPSGKKFYVNSLEGGKTIVYDFETKEKTKVIRHSFASFHDEMWAPASGFFVFNEKRTDSLSFTGKPVESTFVHNGRYLVVPYYRRSFDLNAQEPSALAVIDTHTDTIVRLFETGPLPKMIATSPDEKLVAVTHWGDNTVGLLNVASDNPKNWYYTSCYIVDYKLKLDYPKDIKVDRDVGSGYCLRGTVFTPDNHYLLVGCMGGSGGIAVIDIFKNEYIGRVTGTMPNLRHILIDNEYIYASINNSGYVQRIQLDKFLSAINSMNGRKAHSKEWESCKVASGARTIVLSPDGKYIFAACSYSSCISIIRADSMTLAGSIAADSYPVGLDISADGTILISTSQGHNGAGGNAVDIYRVNYKK